MSKTELFSNQLIIELPEGFEYMNEEENKSFFPNHIFDYSFILRDKNSVMGIELNDTPLACGDVEERINQYYTLYSRMTPGFVMGEMKIKPSNDVSFGIFSFKSNAPKRDLFNIVMVANFFEKELFVIATGDLNDAEILIPEFIKMIDQMEICK